jgi:hypothetical protein
MNAAYLVLGLLWTHRRLLRGQLSAVIFLDIGPMILVCALILAIMRTDPLESLNTWARLTAGAGVTSIAFILSAMATNQMREEILNRIQTLTHLIKKWFASSPYLDKGENRS